MLREIGPHGSGDMKLASLIIHAQSLNGIILLAVFRRRAIYINKKSDTDGAPESGY